MIFTKILLISHFFYTTNQLVSECKLGDEVCACNFNRIFFNIKMECLNSTPNTINLFNLGQVLKCSNDYELNIDLVIQNKFLKFDSICSDETQNPNLNLISSLTLANNKIMTNTLENNCTNFLPSMNKLNLYLSEISNIEVVWFRLNTNMKQLNLSSNGLKLLQNDTFISVQSLETLWLYSNEIEIIEANSFLGLSNLKYLHLNSNRIKKLCVHSFTPLRKLEQLFLHQNELSSLEGRVLSQLGSLVVVHLYGNKLTHINKETFSNMQKLEKLFLYSNQINSIEVDSFANLTSLKELRIENNRIQHLEYLLFIHLSKLDTLLLSYNLISEDIKLNEKLFYRYL